MTGKYRFLTCSLVSGDMPQRVPLISIPVHTGYNMARDAIYRLDFVKLLFKSIRLTLFDRRFYSSELRVALDRADVPYLISVPKNGVSIQHPPDDPRQVRECAVPCCCNFELHDLLLNIECCNPVEPGSTVLLSVNDIIREGLQKLDREELLN